MANRPDIIVKNKEVTIKEFWKLSKYKDLKIAFATTAGVIHHCRNAILILADDKSARKTVQKPKMAPFNLNGRFHERNLMMSLDKL